MKIINNIEVQVHQDLECGEIIQGENSGDYYLVIEGDKALNLKSLRVQQIKSLSFKRTGIKKENITITFE